MKHFDIETFIKDLDKQFNDMQDKAIAGSENVATASWVIKNQAKEIEVLKKFKNEIDADNAKLFEVAQKANAMWDRATGKAQEK
jgi:hypothetical protein